MKLLVDACISHRVAAEFAAAGHDVAWVGDQENPPSDIDVLQQALREQRVVVTLDKDFGELAVTGQRSHPGIVRLVDFPMEDQAKACMAMIGLYPIELEEGALLTISPGRVRIRPSRR